MSHRSRRLVIGATVLAMAALGAAARLGGSGVGIKCSLAQVKDAERSGLVAYTYFVPDGWTAKPSFKWNGNTYVAELQAFTSDKGYQVDMLEPMNLNYNASNGTVQSGFRITSGTDFLHALINRMQQSGAATNIRIVEESNQDLPLTDTQKLMQQGRMIGGMSQKTFRQSAYMKFTFQRNGLQETGNVGTVVAGNLLTNNMQLGIGSTARQFGTENGTYVIGPTMFIVTPSSPSAAKVKEAQLVASSTSMTPKFASFCAQLALQMAIDNGRRLQIQGEQLRKDMEAQTQKTLDEYKAKWARNDANTHDFCNYILDQQDYHDPSGGIVTLPNNYSHAWANSDGQYVVTDDPTFNPKGTERFGFQNWQELTKAEHGQ